MTTNHDEQQSPRQQGAYAAFPFEDRNPWLVTIGITAFLALPLGVGLYIAGLTSSGNAFRGVPDGDPVMMAWGLVIASIGVTMTVAWLACAAVCWQLQDRRVLALDAVTEALRGLHGELAAGRED